LIPIWQIFHNSFSKTPFSLIFFVKVREFILWLSIAQKKKNNFDRTVAMQKQCQVFWGETISWMALEMLHLRLTASGMPIIPEMVQMAAMTTAAFVFLESILQIQFRKKSFWTNFCWAYINHTLDAAEILKPGNDA
jgi:hypothetical protein